MISKEIHWLACQVAPLGVAPAATDRNRSRKRLGWSREMRLRSVFFVTGARSPRFSCQTSPTSEFRGKTRKSSKISENRLIMQHSCQLLKHPEGVITQAHRHHGRLGVAQTTQNGEVNAFAQCFCGQGSLGAPRLPDKPTNEFLWKSRKTLKIRGKRLILQHFPEFLKHLDGVVAHANQCNGRLELALTSQNQEANAFLDSIRVFKFSIFQIFDENIFWYRKFPDFTDL